MFGFLCLKENGRQIFIPSVLHILPDDLIDCVCEWEVLRWTVETEDLNYSFTTVKFPLRFPVRPRSSPCTWSGRDWGCLSCSGWWTPPAPWSGGTSLMKHVENILIFYTRPSRNKSLLYFLLWQPESLRIAPGRVSPSSSRWWSWWNC